MTSAKDIRIAPIAREDANCLIKRLHYSGTFVRNTQLHFGVFLGDQLEGAIQLGPSLDKSRLVGLVRETPWHGFIEINRMAFSESLPRNSESRALAITMRIIKRRYPQLQWVVSFADGTCCGDGTIYRAAGFLLTGINKNKTIVILPDGTKTTNMLLTANWHEAGVKAMCKRLGIESKYRPLSEWYKLGARMAEGFQLRYVYFLDPSARGRLTVPILPYSAIDDAGAGMYRGERREKQAMAGDHLAQRRGSTDLRAPDAKGAPEGAPMVAGCRMIDYLAVA